MEALYQRPAPLQSGEGGGERTGSALAQKWILIAVLLSFSVVMGRLLFVQLIRGEDYRLRSQSNFVQRRNLEHRRGEILDQHGRVMVTNRPSANVYITFAFLPNAYRILKRIRSLDLSVKEMEAIAMRVREEALQDGTPFLVKNNVPQSVVELLREEQEALDIPFHGFVVVPGNSKNFYDVYIDPQEYPSRGRVLAELCQILELEEAEQTELVAKVHRNRGLRKYTRVLVARDVKPWAEGRISVGAELGTLAGVSLTRGHARKYLAGQSAASVLGYVNEITLKELKQSGDRGYKGGDWVGRGGLERSFESVLRGRDGSTAAIVDSKGRAQRGALAAELKNRIELDETPEPGERLVLSIDADLQRFAEESFTERAGTAIVMDVHTGRLLTVTSTPAFDPNRLTGRNYAAERARLRTLRAYRPFRVRPTQDFFVPGSVFKVVTAIAAHEEGVMGENEKVHCPGHFRLGRTRFRCWKDQGHGSVGLEEAIAKSCDVYFYEAGKRLGLDAISKHAHNLGFGKRTGIQLEEESKGIMPDVKWYKKRRGYYSLGAAVNASIGQGAVTVTPMQVAVAYAALGNGGTVYVPQLILRTESSGGETLREFFPEVAQNTQISPKLLQRVRQGLSDVVNSPWGTARGSRSSKIAFAGKTGTAQVAKLGAERHRGRDIPWKLRDHAWFAALAPAEQPEIAVVVFVEHGSGGSKAAAPIAKKIVEYWHEHRERISSAGLPVGGP